MNVREHSSPTVSEELSAFDAKAFGANAFDANAFDAKRKSKSV